MWGGGQLPSACFGGAPHAPCTGSPGNKKRAAWFAAVGPDSAALDLQQPAKFVSEKSVQVGSSGAEQPGKSLSSGPRKALFWGIRASPPESLRQEQGVPASKTGGTRRSENPALCG